jgi:hypothetical protein
MVPNIEKIEGKNSLDDRIYKIYTECLSKDIPIFYGLNKFSLGKVSRKKNSCVSILAFVNIEGFERDFKTLLDFAEQYRKQFYQKYKDSRETFLENKFIRQSLFDIYNTDREGVNISL